MAVVSPERTPRAPDHAPPPPPPRQEPPRGRIPWGLLVLLLVVVGIAWSVDRLIGVFPSFDNPFATETVDRSGPAVLKSIRDIGEYRAASGDFQVIVDLERDTGLPDELLGERVLFVAAGTVDSGVDLGALGDESVEVSDDRRTATIVLPPARLYEPRLDLGRSYTYDHSRGLFNRIGGVFSSDPGSQQEVHLLAEEKLREAAAGGAGLVPRAEENTRRMLESLLTALGFTTVDVRFED